MNTNTLIIHPKDQTTTFLNDVYANIEKKTVIQNGLSREELIDLMKTHDRIMMMGHGSPYGLFSVGQFVKTPMYLIDKEIAGILEMKKNNIFIWCYASSFMESLSLSGFGTGMFISEVDEAIVCGLDDINQEMVDESNWLFVNEISKYINLNTSAIYEKMIEGDYQRLAEINPVAKYNFERLYYGDQIRINQVN